MTYCIRVVFSLCFLGNFGSLLLIKEITQSLKNEVHDDLVNFTKEYLYQTKFVNGKKIFYIETDFFNQKLRQTLPLISGFATALCLALMSGLLQNSLSLEYSNPSKNTTIVY